MHAQLIVEDVRSDNVQLKLYEVQMKNQIP